MLSWSPRSFHIGRRQVKSGRYRRVRFRANVICHGSFVQSPAGDDQAFVTASGQFSYRSANMGIGYTAPFDTLIPGQTDHIQGWTIVAGGNGIRYTVRYRSMALAESPPARTPD